MLLRTHLVFGIFFILLFFQYVQQGFLFALFVLIASAVPDIDTQNSSYGRHLIFRPLQFIFKHRGVLHSIFAAVLFSGIIAIFWPVASLGFFVGYSIHLVVDSFTKEGVFAFWPFSWQSKGPILSGGIVDETLFFVMIVVDLLVFVFFLL
ncbi:MAG: metal-dependent hydrolase [Nanoarchaeota archaeon]